MSDKQPGCLCMCRLGRKDKRGVDTPGAPVQLLPPSMGKAAPAKMPSPPTTFTTSSATASRTTTNTTTISAATNVSAVSSASAAVPVAAPETASPSLCPAPTDAATAASIAAAPAATNTSAAPPVPPPVPLNGTASVVPSSTPSGNVPSVTLVLSAPPSPPPGLVTPAAPHTTAAEQPTSTFTATGEQPPGISPEPDTANKFQEPAAEEFAVAQAPGVTEDVAVVGGDDDDPALAASSTASSAFYSAGGWSQFGGSCDGAEGALERALTAMPALDAELGVDVVWAGAATGLGASVGMRPEAEGGEAAREADAGPSESEAGATGVAGGTATGDTVLAAAATAAGRTSAAGVPLEAGSGLLISAPGDKEPQQVQQQQQVQELPSEGSTRQEASTRGDGVGRPPGEASAAAQAEAHPQLSPSDGLAAVAATPEPESSPAAAPAATESTAPQPPTPTPPPPSPPPSGPQQQHHHQQPTTDSSAADSPHTATAPNSTAVAITFSSSPTTDVTAAGAATTTAAGSSAAGDAPLPSLPAVLDRVVDLYHHRGSPCKACQVMLSYCKAAQVAPGSLRGQLAERDVPDVEGLTQVVQRISDSLSDLRAQEGWQLVRDDELRLAYRHLPRAGQHAFRAECELDAPTEHLLALARETDLCPTWNKYCTSSAFLREMTNTDVMVYMSMWVPWPFHDVGFRVEANGAELLDEEGCLHVAFSSPDKETASNVELPPGAERHSRIRLMQPSCLSFTPLPPRTPGGSPRTLARVQVYVDPGTRAVPAFIISFVLKVLSPFMYGAVKKVLASAFKDPNGPLPTRMRQRRELYDMVRRRSEAFLAAGGTGAPGTATAKAAGATGASGTGRGSGSGTSTSPAGAKAASFISSFRSHSGSRTRQG